MPVSVWVKKLEGEEPRCLVVMEPVDRTTAKVTFDATVRVQREFLVAMLSNFMVL